MIILILILIIAIIAVWYVSAMNSMRRLQVQIEESLSGIDVALTKRFDTLTKMFDVAKSYANFERETILGAIELRQGMSMAERNEASGQMDAAREQLRFLAENYPQLGANENFKELQYAVMDTEEHLQAARRLYNRNVSTLNQKIVAFPTSLIANQLGIHREDFFEAEQQKRADVNLSF